MRRLRPVSNSPGPRVEPYLALRTFSSASPSPAPPARKARFFDRLLGEDPEPLREYKARESRIVREQLGRSKFSDAARAWGGEDKVRCGSTAPGAASTVRLRSCSAARTR